MTLRTGYDDVELVLNEYAEPGWRDASELSWKWSCGIMKKLKGGFRLTTSQSRHPCSKSLD